MVDKQGTITFVEPFAKLSFQGPSLPTVFNFFRPELQQQLSNGVWALNPKP